jgi:chloramphenicol 3-O phosphotransferase
VGLPGQVVVLNGAPRSGKTTIARAMQDELDGQWVNLGVDVSQRATPRRLQPGIGLRPGGERPDLEDAVVLLYAALYESVAAHARLGLDVVVDVGHHESYSRPLGILPDCARRLRGLPVLWVGVRCPLEVIWQRRADSWGQRREEAEPHLVAAVDRWQHDVHAHGGYDLELDTTRRSALACARTIGTRLANGPPGTAIARLGDDEAPLGGRPPGTAGA